MIYLGQVVKFCEYCGLELIKTPSYATNTYFAKCPERLKFTEGSFNHSSFPLEEEIPPAYDVLTGKKLT